ncbi:MAG: nucleoside hydrolase [Bacteroidales bacterium]|jgi:pyrimidine-specific ribonucleoside hydrolase|nr:nucleoside hydrolase [Bacteroidales bacterium]
MRRFFCFIFLIGCFCAAAHSGKARFHVLIDTDGAADDFRAICMLLGNREVEVLSVTTSEGALTPDVAALKVTALLRHFHHEGIPVGAGRMLNISPPAWRRQSEKMLWGDTARITAPEQTAVEVIISAMENEEEKIILICLGALTNLSDVLVARPQLKERIDRVIWYNSSDHPLKGANYDADRASADKTLAAGVHIDMVSGNDLITINEDYLRSIAAAGGAYAQHIVDTHSGDALQSVVASGHMKAWDDLTVAYLFAPELFHSVRTRENITVHSPADAHAIEQIRQTLVETLAGKPDSESRVFAMFPEDPGLYAADVAPVAKNLIERYGHSEWRAGVLANELHGHLGIYAVIGVKMGIRAREYFNIGVDDIAVVSYAGARPPVSCLNDGLQVSTGATIGHGLIRVSNEQDIRPEAVFTFKNKTIRMKLKPEYVQQIRQDVTEGIRLHGDLTEAYWEYIRLLAIKYWQELDRHEIFDRTVDR